MSPEWQIGVMLTLVVLSVIMFSFEWVAADVTALCLLLSLILLRLVPAEVAFSGFSSDTVMLTLGLLLMTAALLKTGVMDLLGGKILRITGTNPNHLLLVIMITAAGLSAFMSNTACTAFFVPVILGIAQKSKISPTKLLLPLAFASIVSSSVSVISTSTNIVVSGYLKQAGMQSMGMFELAPVGIPIAVLGVAYVYWIGRRWLPDRAVPEELSDQFGLRPYLSELLVLPTSTLIGKSLKDLALGQSMDLKVLRVVREKHNYLAPRGNLVLASGDVLLVEGNQDEILRIKETAGVEIKADFKLGDPTISAENLGLVEVLILPKSPLLHRTLKGAGFRERYGLQVLGVNRRGQNLLRKISQVPLRVGDMLLLQGAKDKLSALVEDHGFQVIGQVLPDQKHRKKAPLAVIIFVLALVLGTTKLLPLPVAMLLGAAACFLTRCITSEQAYRDVEWKAVILIGCMLGLGQAMEATGTAKFLAGQIVHFATGYGPLWVLGGFFLLTTLLTQTMSNQAAAIVLLPVAVQTAQQLNYNPRTFCMMIAVAASCSYLTPLEPSCLMVYGPGRYRFVDFLKIGSLLTLIIFVVAMVLVPMRWPLVIR